MAASSFFEPGGLTLEMLKRQSTVLPSGNFVPPSTGQWSGVSREPTASRVRHTSLVRPARAAVTTLPQAQSRSACVTVRDRTIREKRWYEGRGMRGMVGSERFTAASPNLGQ
eukprot:scaffold57395_cov31-Tisochrysis_lutea.AAC.1